MIHERLKTTLKAHLLFASSLPIIITSSTILSYQSTQRTISLSEPHSPSLLLRKTFTENASQNETTEYRPATDEVPNTSYYFHT
jgi:hypothetical protein